MKKVLIWVALGLMGLGVALFVGLGFMVDFDFLRLDTMKYLTNTYDITDIFHSIDVDTITADVEFRLAEDGKCRVVCYEQEEVLHDVHVKDGTLVIDAKDTRSWLDHLSFFNFKTPSITVYLPEQEYQALEVNNTTGDLKLSGPWCLDKLSLKVTTGDIRADGMTCKKDIDIHVTTGSMILKNLNCEKLNVSGSTGQTTMKNVRVSEKAQLRWTTGGLLMEDCGVGNLSLDGTTGDAMLKNVVVSDNLRAETTTGDLKLEHCDAGELFLKATTGDTSASLLTQKIVFAHASTGDVDVPSFTTGGRCEVTTTTGDICIRIP